MPTEQYSLMPDVGVAVQVYYLAHAYRGHVIRHGTRYPVVRFVLRNGRTIESRATIIEHDAYIPHKYSGLLGRMYHPTFYDR